MRKILTWSVFIIGLLLVDAAFSARKPSKPRPKTDKKVYLIHSDRLFFDQFVMPDAQILAGNVALRHNDVRFFCDSAHVYEQSNSFQAFGSVKMLQGDTLSLTGDYLYYNGETQIAEVRHNVRLKHKASLLETDSLNYDRLYDVGYFFDGGRLTDAGNVLTSDWGEYAPGTNEAVFNYNVRLDNDKFSLRSDTLHYNTDTKQAHVVGPSNIKSGESHIYSTDGIYNTQSGRTVLLKRSVVKNTDSDIVGDSIINDKEEGVTEAFGAVVINNKSNKTIMSGEYSYYNEKTGFALVTDSALVKDYSNAADTMFLHADTFKLYSYHLETDSVYRVMHGYRHARAFRSDVQMVCDSLNFNSRDKRLALYRDPIVWQNNQQILGEQIFLFMNDSTIDSAKVVNRSLLVEQIDSVHFNQINSVIMTSYFTDGQIRESVADGTVNVIFYQIDRDSLLVGMNSTKTTKMRMFMKDKKLDRIWTPAATGNFYPPMMITSENMYLDNFAWFDYIRPIDKYDLFEWQPKRAGTELKASPRRRAPLQTISDKPE